MYYHFWELRFCFRKFRFRFRELVPDNGNSVPVFGNSLSVFGPLIYFWGLCSIMGTLLLFLGTRILFSGTLFLFSGTLFHFRGLHSINGDCVTVFRESVPFSGTVPYFLAFSGGLCWPAGLPTFCKGIQKQDVIFGEGGNWVQLLNRPPPKKKKKTTFFQILRKPRVFL